MADCFRNPLRLGVQNSGCFSFFQAPIVPFRNGLKRVQVVPITIPLRFEKRRSSSGVLFVSVYSSGSSSNSLPADLDLLSRTECSDGSVVFRFGNKSEITTNDVSEVPEASEAADKGFGLEDADKSELVVVSHTDCPPEITKVNLNHAPKVEAKSYIGIGKQGKSAGEIDLVAQAPPDLDDSSSLSSAGKVDSARTVLNVVKSTDSGEVLVESRKDRVKSSNAITNAMDTLDLDNCGGLDGDSNINLDSEVNVCTDKNEHEIVSQPSATELESSGASNSGVSRISDRESEGIGIACLSELEKVELAEATAGNITIEGRKEGDLIVELPASAIEVEPILDEETTHVNVSVDVDKVESLLAEEFADVDGHGSDVAEGLNSEAKDKPLGKAIGWKDISTATLVLSSGAASLPHPAQALAGGEDAYFVAFQKWLGVADGTGQWSLEGTNTGHYARELMENCEKFLLDQKDLPEFRPEELITRSAARSESSGLSTILVVYFDGQALHAANFGDSGFIVIRNGAVFKRSSPMVHEFNFPLQIKRGDDPSELIAVHKIDLDEGDVIVTATDGLFDNLYEQEIVSITCKSFLTNLKPPEIAEFLAGRAQEVGRSTSARSPFADAAQAAGYGGCAGGRQDDVTVIVSVVQKLEA